MFRYGWPDNFRTDDFRRDIEGMQQQWHREAMERVRQDELDGAEQRNMEEKTKNVIISETSV